MTSEAARDKNIGANCILWGSLPAQEFPKVQKEGIMNDPKSHQKSKRSGVIFEKRCTYDPYPPLAKSLVDTIVDRYVKFYCLSIHCKSFPMY